MNQEIYNPPELSTTIDYNIDLTNISIYGITSINTTVISNILLKSANINLPTVSCNYDDDINTFTTSLVVNQNQIGVFFDSSSNQIKNYCKLKI